MISAGAFAGDKTPIALVVREEDGEEGGEEGEENGVRS